MIISYYPERSTFLEYMKQNLDEGVYDRSEYAQPNLPAYTIKGEDADPGVVTMYNGDNVMGVVIADPDGNFSFTFDVVYDQSYQIRAEDSSENKSNILDFELFNYVTLLYIISLRMNEIRKQIAQRKQDIYVEDKVGDSLESLFFVDQNVFQTRLLTLMDKFVYGNITDYLNEEERDIYTKDNVSKSMKISELGCLIKSLSYLKEIFISLLNDSNLEIYLYPQSDFGTVLRSVDDSFTAIEMPGGLFKKIGEETVGWTYNVTPITWYQWLAISSDNKYLAGADYDHNKVYLYKIESDGSLTELDCYDLAPETGKSYGISSVYFDEDDYLYAGASTLPIVGTWKFDISGETLNKLVWATLKAARVIASQGSYLYIGKNDAIHTRRKSDLQTVDLITEEGNAITHNGTDIWVDDRQSNKLAYIDASDPNNLTSVDAIEDIKANALFYWDNHLFVGCQGLFLNKKFQIYDASSPSTPGYSLEGEVDLPSGSPTWIILNTDEKIAFVGGSSKVYSIDFSDIANPFIISSYNLDLMSLAYDSDNNRLYGINKTDGKIIILKLYQSGLKIPCRGERYRYEYNLIALNGGSEMSITGSGYYHWIYIDGDLDPTDGIWKIKQTEVQPLPATINRVETYLTAGIYTDTTGNITGLVNQRYIIVDKHILRDETYMVYDPDSNEMDITLLGGKIIALGVFEDLASVQAVYKTLYEPKILAVVKMDAGGDIEKIQRTYNEPNHSEVGSLQLEKDTNIFIKTDIVISGKEKDLIYDCISTIIPVNSPKNIFINKYNLVSNPFATDGDGVGGVDDWEGETIIP